MTLVLNCDGAIEPKNPGGWGVCGWVLKSQDGKRLADGTHDCGEFPEQTNNRVEYQAVLYGLSYLLTANKIFETVEVRTDSKLVVQQLNDLWNCANDDLRKLRNQILSLIRDFKCEVIFKWVPRAENADADEASRRLYINNETRKNIVNEYMEH